MATYRRGRPPRMVSECVRSPARGVRARACIALLSIHAVPHACVALSQRGLGAEAEEARGADLFSRRGAFSVECARSTIAGRCPGLRQCLRLVVGFNETSFKQAMPHRVAEPEPVTFGCTKASCLDRAGCRRPFRVYVVTRANAPPPTHYCLKTPVLDEWSQSLVTHSPTRACAFFVQLRSCRGDELRVLSTLPHWHGDGFRFVLRDATDKGITQAERRGFLGRAAIASTRTDVTRFVPGLDVSIALPGESARPRLRARFARTPAHARRWLLTFKGSLAAHKRGREIGLLHHNEPRRVVIVGRYKGKECPNPPPLNVSPTGAHKPVARSHPFSAEHARCCARIDALYSSYEYDDLMNTTFGLLPPGRQPATNRLSEVMAAGAIPVFFGVDGSILPYPELIDWAALSLNVPADADLSADVVPLLERLVADRARLGAMEAAVRAAYDRYFSGGEEMSNHLVLETFRRRYEFELGRRRTLRRTLRETIVAGRAHRVRAA